MNTKSPDEFEYKNRLQEILDFNLTKTVSKQEVAKFIDKIVDWVQFLEENSSYKNRIRVIYDVRPVRQIISRLDARGDEIVNICRSLLREALEVLKNKDITLLTHNQVLDKHLVHGVGVFSPTVDESLGMTLDELNSKLYVGKSISINEIEGIVLSIFRVKWDFDTLKIELNFPQEALDKLSNLKEEFRSIVDEYERKRRYYASTDYDLIHGVWEKMTDKAIGSNQVDFILSPAFRVIDESNPSFLRTSTSSEIVEDLEKYRRSVKAVDMRLQEGQIRKIFTWYRRLWRFILSCVSKLIGWMMVKV